MCCTGLVVMFIVIHMSFDYTGTVSRPKVHHVFFYFGGNSKSLVFVFWKDHHVRKNIYLPITKTQLSDMERTHTRKHIILLHLFFAKYNFPMK